MLCSAQCVSFKSDEEIKRCSWCNAVVLKNLIILYEIEEKIFLLDGEGTEQKATLSIGEGFVPSSEFEVLCDGYHSFVSDGEIMYKPEFGNSYKVTSPGGPNSTKPLFEE